MYSWYARDKIYVYGYAKDDGREYVSTLSFINYFRVHLSFYLSKRYTTRAININQHVQTSIRFKFYTHLHIYLFWLCIVNVLKYVDDLDYLTHRRKCFDPALEIPKFPLRLHQLLSLKSIVHVNLYK